MPLWLPPSALGPTEINVTATDRNGTTITTGAANTKGAYSAGQIFASVAEDVVGVTIAATGVAVSAGNTGYLLDLGIGPSGSEVDLIQNIDFGAAQVESSGFNAYFFPVFIPKGERLAARAQGAVVNDVAEVIVVLHRAPAGWAMEVPKLWESLGAVTASSRGTLVSAANGAFGSWTTIATTTKNYDRWHVGFDLAADTTASNSVNVIELGFGPDTANVSTIGTWVWFETGVEASFGPIPNSPVYQPIPSGTAIFARIAGSHNEARGIIVYGGVS